MTIHRDNLTEGELIDLNRKIIERLEFLRQTRAHEAMLEFRIGERVQFNPEGRETVTGMLTRYNKSTVRLLPMTVLHNDTRPVKLVRRAPSTEDNVVPITKK